MLRKDKRTGVELLLRDLAENPFYPFRLGLTYEDRSRVYKWAVPYRQSYLAKVVLCACVFSMALLAATNSTSNSMFVYVLLVFCQSLAVTMSYRLERVYVLDEGTKTYAFMVGSAITNGRYHNIYIRLSKEKSVGPAATLPRYNLVLDGVKIDRQLLTKRSSGDIKSLRKCVAAWQVSSCPWNSGLTVLFYCTEHNYRLGQRLAKSLNVNYFDEANGTFALASSCPHRGGRR